MIKGVPTQATVAALIPEGCAVVDNLVNPKYAQRPCPYPFNMATREGSGHHQLHALLEKEWMTYEELVSLCGQGPLALLTPARLDNLLGFYKGGQWHYWGWYLVQNLTDGKFHLVYRDPAEHYLVEYGPHLKEEDKTPDMSWKEKMEAKIAAANAPAAPKTPRTRSTKSQPGVAPGTKDSPSVECLKQLASVGLLDEFNKLVEDFIIPEAHDELRAIVDHCGMRGQDCVTQISNMQKAAKIKAGFFKFLVDLDAKFSHLQQSPAQ